MSAKGDNMDSQLLTLSQIKDARKVVDSSPYSVRTPMLHNVQGWFDIDPSITVHLKLENTQTMGEIILCR